MRSNRSNNLHSLDFQRDGKESPCRSRAGRVARYHRGLTGCRASSSELETEILPARVADYQAGNLDTLMAAGEVTWVGVEQIGDRNGRIALYLTEALPLLRLPDTAALAGTVTGQVVPQQTPHSERAEKIAEFLARQGASFFSEIHNACGGGFPGDTVEALWQLVWAGESKMILFIRFQTCAARRSQT